MSGITAEPAAHYTGGREAGKEHKALGHDCDRHQWERVRKQWKDS